MTQWSFMFVYYKMFWLYILKKKMLYILNSLVGERFGNILFFMFLFMLETGFVYLLTNMEIDEKLY